MASTLPNPAHVSWLKHQAEELALKSYPAPFDEALWTALLFCIVAGDKHLVVRTRPEDVSVVQKLAKSILSTIFGYSCVPLKLKPESTPEDLLSMAFLSGPAPGINTNPSNRIPRPRRRNMPHSASRTPSGYDSIAPDRIPHTPHDRFRVSVAATVASDASVRGLRPHSYRGVPATEHDLLSVAYSPGLNSPMGPRPFIPQALVVTGLELANQEAQETLWEVIRTRTVVIGDEDGFTGETWNLPEGFLVVSVNGLGDGQTRPSIIKALLDRFAFNTNFVNHEDNPASGASQPSKAALMDHDYVERLQLITHNVTINDTLAIYISNIISALRHHPQVDPSLITSRATKDLTELTKASCALTSGAQSLDTRLFATDADVKRIVRAVLGHRIAIRKSYEDEILGSLFAARRIGSNKKATPPTRRTIKDILDEVLAAAG